MPKRKFETQPEPQPYHSSGGGSGRNGTSSYAVDFSQVTHEQLEEWYDQLVQAQLEISGLREVPVPLKVLAERAGIPQRAARHALNTHGAKIIEYVRFDVEPVAPTPEELQKEWLTVEGAAAEAGVSKSHIYVVLRDPTSNIRTARVANITFIHRSDLGKLRLIRQ